MLSSQNWVKKIQSCIPCRTGGKNIKKRNYNNFGSKIYFCRKNFKRLSKFVKLVLRSQFICLKVSINSYFDPFITICTWCTNKDLSWPNLWLMTSQRGSIGREVSQFCNVQKLTWEMNCSPQILHGYWYWSFYHCWYIMYKFRSFLTQFCVHGVITGGKTFKPHLNVSLPMSFDLISPIVLDIIQIWASFDPILEYIRQNERLGMGHNITALKNWSQKWITNPEKIIVIEFDLSISVGI